MACPPSGSWELGAWSGEKNILRQAPSRVPSGWLPNPCFFIRYHPFIRTRVIHRHNRNGFTNFVAKKTASGADAGRCHGEKRRNGRANRWFEQPEFEATVSGAMLWPSTCEHACERSRHAYPLPRESMPPNNNLGGYSAQLRQQCMQQVGRCHCVATFDSCPSGGDSVDLPHSKWNGRSGRQRRWCQRAANRRD
jgi:hypothetical protein